MSKINRPTARVWFFFVIRDSDLFRASNLVLSDYFFVSSLSHRDAASLVNSPLIPRIENP